MSLGRSRWAAVGAAIAISLGAGGIGLVNATIGSGDRAVFVPIEPCRIADTRSASQIGLKSSPMGPGETHTIQAHGTNGDCTIPADATSLSMNVTAVAAIQSTYITIWSSGSRPLASSLNSAAGTGPIPNAVNTPLSPTGAFNVYNFAGTVEVVVDINGYYVNHNHDDRYYTKSQIDARKFININTMRNVDGVTADSPFGGALGTFDTSLILPPDYTPSTALTLRVNLLKSQFGLTSSCTVQLLKNYVYAFHPSSTAPIATGLIGNTIVTLDAVEFDTKSVEFTLTGDFLPGDTLTLGLYASGGGTTCSATDTSVHSAAIYYD